MSKIPKECDYCLGKDNYGECPACFQCKIFEMAGKEAENRIMFYAKVGIENVAYTSTSKGKDQIIGSSNQLQDVEKICDKYNRDYNYGMIDRDGNLQNSRTTLRIERTKMTKEEMLRALWLMDEYVNTFGWHFVSEDGFPEPNEHGFWCKMKDGTYRILHYKDGFCKKHGSADVYISDDAQVVAWQRLTEIACER